MRRWVESAAADLPPVDLITCVPDLPDDWGTGPWLRLAGEHIWTCDFAPGQWALNREFLADIWLQTWPMLIQVDDLPQLLQSLKEPTVQRHLTEMGRSDPHQEWHVSLSRWAELHADWDQEFRHPEPFPRHPWLPVPWRPFAAECGHPDRHDEQGRVLMPVPSLFREWDLELDMRRGLILQRGTPLLGLAGLLFGEDTLLTQKRSLQELLVHSGYALIWSLCGERRAFLNIGSSEPDTSAWADYRGVAYLGPDGRVQTPWLHKTLRHRK